MKKKVTELLKTLGLRTMHHLGGPVYRTIDGKTVTGIIVGMTSPLQDFSIVNVQTRNLVKKLAAAGFEIVEDNTCSIVVSLDGTDYHLNRYNFNTYDGPDFDPEYMTHFILFTEIKNLKRRIS